MGPYWHTVLQFAQSNGFAGQIAEPPPEVSDAFAGVASPSGPKLVLPLHPPFVVFGDRRSCHGLQETPELNGPMRALLEEICSLVEVGLERELFRRAADIDRDVFYEQAIHDPLTGLYNRQYLDDAARRLCAVDDRTLRPSVAVLMIDLDYFKKVNDDFGHSAGDSVLQHVARSILEGSRRGDIVVRYGGEEFVVVLSGVDLTIAQSVAERIRETVAKPDDGRPRRHRQCRSGDAQPRRAVRTAHSACRQGHVPCQGGRTRQSWGRRVTRLLD